MENISLKLREISKHYEEKLKKIKVCLFDIDGILTDGMVYYGGQEIGFNRSFNVLDGYGIRLLKLNGFKIGFITGGNSLGIQKRFEYLQADYLYMGSEDKRKSYLSVLKDSGCSDEEILYMGDEFFDIPLLKRAGFSATVPHASAEIQTIVDYVTVRNGGQGAVREVIDLIRYAQNIVPNVPDFD